ncbi:translocase of chloroplast 132 chloroplastic-like, partial [Trifolium medium]|nr:translocase of chloroplast 132 chloroplastic-like [Trifolium medium]
DDDEEEVEVIANEDVPEDQQEQLYNKEAEGGVSCDSIKDDYSGGKELTDLNADGSMVFQEGRDLVNGDSGLLSEKG